MSSGGMSSSIGTRSRSRAPNSKAVRRAAGPLARQEATSAASGPGTPGSAGILSVTCRRSTAPGWPPPNGVQPVSSSNSTVPSAYMSTAGPGCKPSMTSGAR
ncbi:MAG: hypothetical protein AUG49_25520 [Catenulispora sp. 13_1_20CM_3_70_7]|nr:MAG: hypothetical protein AUG49_25520 [Catenulispora sp. 13_1_20CM_3_70_7]